MNVSIKVILFFIFLVLGSILLVGLYFLQPYFTSKHQVETSDAGSLSGTVAIGVDNWVGYFPLCGNEMRKRLRGAGYRLNCVDDEANYTERMRKLADGSLNFAVATVDSFILNAAPVSFPGTIIAVLDESKGGDAIVADKSVVGSIEDLKKASGLKIAFTPNSPSDHLLKSVAVHFDIPLLKQAAGPWRVEAQGSSDALKMLQDKTVPVAVMWEPDVSRALEAPGFTKLLGTENTTRLIVDILVVNRDFSVQQPDLVKLVLTAYFRTLKAYRDDPVLLKTELRETTRLNEKQIEQMLQGVAWTTLGENAQKWFAVKGGSSLGEDGLVDTIESTVRILLERGDFSSSPLPDSDPYRLQNRSFIKELFAAQASGQFGQTPTAADATPSFPALNAAAWKRLREVGTLKIHPITFQSGTSDLSFDGKLELDKAVANLKHYPNFRVVVRGHTGLKGDAQANKALSQERAESVQRYLTIAHNVDPNRLRAVGLGSEQPLPRSAGESARAYRYRLPRVELYLMAENF